MPCCSVISVVPHPERLVELSVARGGDKIPFFYPMFRELDHGQRVFSGLIGWSDYTNDHVEVNGVFARNHILAVTGNYYSQLGVALYSAVYSYRKTPISAPAQRPKSP